jgi:hypothetical protein
MLIYLLYFHLYLHARSEITFPQKVFLRSQLISGIVPNIFRVFFLSVTMQKLSILIRIFYYNFCMDTHIFGVETTCVFFYLNLFSTCVCVLLGFRHTSKVFI